MKKYKLNNQDILSKTVINANGLNYRCSVQNNLKIYLTGILSGIACQIVNISTDYKYSEFILPITIGSCGILVSYVLKSLHDLLEFKKDKIKLSKLEKTLKEKKINACLNNCSYDDNIVFLTGNNYSYIKCYDEDDIVFYDMDNPNGLDITYDVKKCLMKKSEFKKYNKSLG